jgi:HD-GYP domain-containing protein (c-di-GMP phosphodiesterase class II)/HAMP domain-containing protein
MKSFRLPLHMHLSTLFIVITVIISGAIAAIGYRMSYDMLAASAEDLTHRASREVIGEIQALARPVHTTVEIFSQSPLVNAKNLQERMSSLRAMAMPLQESAGVTSLYVGYGSGDFFMLQRLNDDEERIRLKAPEGTHFIVRSIERGSQPAGKLIYLDEHKEHLSEELRPGYASSYDPRARDWFIQAQRSTETVTTEPYIFFSSRKVGMSIARRAGNGRAVIGADIPLDAIGAVLQRQKITPSSQMALVRMDGKVIAQERLNAMLADQTQADAKPELQHIDVFGIAPMKGLATAIVDAQQHGEVSRLVTLGDTRWQTTIQPLQLKGAYPIYLISAIPENELFAVALKIRSASIVGTLLILLVAIPAIWFMARAISRSMRALANEADAIRHFDFDSPVKVKSIITEVHWLAETMELMKRSIRKFMSITHAVAAEENFEALLSMLLKDTMNVSKAETGALYLAEDTLLVPSIALDANENEIGGRLLAIPLTGANTPQLLRNSIARQEALNGEMTQEERERFGLDALSGKNGARYSVVVPLFNRQHHLLGLMVLQRHTPMDTAHLAFAGAISDSASSSLETRGLIRDQKALFEAFIQLIAGAIDTKSPYTGGHCARVPVLTEMLAHAACDTQNGPYADFKLSEDEWEAVHVAAWLHDCGKVTTPEYVVDKSTKLETIYDRIHEVRMRFEVLKRDAEIECLKRIHSGTPEVEAWAKLASDLQQIDDDFAFIASCNEGGEFMAPEKIERLKAIATRTWLRTLDDRVGISHEEKERKERVPAAPLPAVEPLLADKPEHRIERRASEKIPPDNKWGFKMKVPELLYNRGEVYNLAVGRGTLSEEERYKINEHIVQTIIMLSALPFPRHLKNVPEIAGGHHEKMDGTGYPKRLTKDEMSPVARMMAIADIFEALTARDRPYKKGKTLSESIKIMGFMKKDKHIDPELFELFLRSGVYRQYAERYMTPEQLDEVDIEAVLSS